MDGVFVCTRMKPGVGLSSTYVKAGQAQQFAYNPRALVKQKWNAQWQAGQTNQIEARIFSLRCGYCLVFKIGYLVQGVAACFGIEKVITNACSLYLGKEVSFDWGIQSL